MHIIVHAVPATNFFFFFSKKKLPFDAFPFHGGQTGRQIWPLRNFFCSFYPFQLKVCIPNNHNYACCFLISTGFGRKMMSQDSKI